ncbi:MAG TPA: putative glycolipid-binding domain-containing protein [Streptosporangiaceae bacterium]|jgi:hypothetical protein
MSADLAWAAVEWPGMEHVVVAGDATGFRADGHVVMADEGLASITYHLQCTTGWRVACLDIEVTSAASTASSQLTSVGDGRWLVDGVPAPELDGCVDVDINCTPLTNTLPIRRLSWSTGAVHDIEVVYVPVPSLAFHRARQRYTLLARDEAAGDDLFRYESGSFRADLQVDGDGFVVDYPGLWRRVERASG